MTVQPVGKCPSCKRVYCLIYSGKTNEFGDRIYRCTVCGATVGSPVSYGDCAIKGRIWKDVFINPCTECKEKRLIQLHGYNICKHWTGHLITDIT